VGLVAFGPALTAWFVADDWDFLILAARAHSPAICFVPLVGRFIRPLVMLTYYGGYHLFGLSPFPYHAVVVLLHVVNAWLAALLTARLGGSRMAAFAGGLLFLVFAGHAEAVTWVAGAADPWLVVFLLAALLLFARALDAERPARLLMLTSIVFALGLLAKETAVIAPALAAAYGAAALAAPSNSSRVRAIAARTAIVTAVTAVTAVLYLAYRARVFGSVFGAYDQLGTSRGVMAAEARKFLLRSFLPAGRWTTGLWVHHYDLLLIVAAAALLIWLLVSRPQGRAAILFLLAALAVSLAPSLPLTISLVDTVSERYVYVATVFSCILVALCCDLLAGRRRALVAGVLAIFTVVHGYGLTMANRTWIDAGRLARTVMDEIIAGVRSAPPTSLMLVLNVPDTAGGAFVIRGAFLNSFYLMAPDVAHPELRALMVASSAMRSARDETRVTRLGDRRFSVELPPGAWFVQSVAPVTAEYGFPVWSPTRYVIALNEPVYRTSLISLVYVSAGALQRLPPIDAPPFGWLDIPADGARCAGESIRIGGWALDDEPDMRVTIERDTGEGTRTPLGTATRAEGTRPDVAAAYPEFPDRRHAEWNYLLPCAAVRASGGRLAVHAVATDRRGQRRELGTRTIVIDGH
jgi:hypothetical protein